MNIRDQILQNIIDQGHRCETPEDLKQVFNVDSRVTCNKCNGSGGPVILGRVNWLSCPCCGGTGQRG